MKKVFLFACLFINCLLFSQKKYTFDYGLIYEVNLPKKTAFSEIYLVNSEKNNYYLYLHDGDSLNSILHFYDYEGLLINGQMPNTIIYKTSDYISNCDDVSRIINPYKYQADNYKFVNLNDTIIKDTAYFHYKIVSLKSLKFQKRKGIKTIHYIVAKNAPNFIPFLWHITMFEVWKKEKNIPNGYPKIIYNTDSEGNITSLLKLINIKKIDRSLSVPDECDYTKNKN